MSTVGVRMVRQTLLLRKLLHPFGIGVLCDVAISGQWDLRVTLRDRQPWPREFDEYWFVTWDSKHVLSVNEWGA